MVCERVSVELLEVSNCRKYQRQPTMPRRFLNSESYWFRVADHRSTDSTLISTEFSGRTPLWFEISGVANAAILIDGSQQADHKINGGWVTRESRWGILSANERERPLYHRGQHSHSSSIQESSNLHTKLLDVRPGSIWHFSVI